MVTLIKYGALGGGEKYNVNQMWIDGLSTDSKPTTTVDGMPIPNGSVYTEIDTGKTYMFDKDNATWHEVSLGGGGGGGFSPIAINTFAAAPPVNEIGSSQTITLGWSLNKTATSQNINGSPVTGTSKQYTGVTGSTSYTLNVSDGQTSASKTAYVTFANRIYYGAASDLATVTSLSSVLSNDPERTITVNAGAEQYIVYAIPARLGDVVFYVGGFEGGFEAPVSQMLTNQSGYAEAYNVYRSTNPNLGETTVEVREG